MKDIKTLVAVAAGRKKAELVLKNANVVNVFTEEILSADVAISGGHIAGVGRYSGTQELDCTGKTLCPGFIDAHIHIESTMVLPRQLVRMALPSGTTTLIADPHEIVNVCGAGAVQFMLNASQGLPCNIYIMLPSSVPTTPYETAGAVFTPADMAPFLHHPQVLGLGEVMCFADVVGARGQIMDCLPLFAQKNVDGHAPGLTGKALQAYAAAGVGSEHESTTFAEAAEKARAGLAILVREGSAAHNLTTIVRGLLDSGIPTDRFMFCTDDKHLEDLRRNGHIRWNVKMAIDMGMPPARAIRMATWNAAQVYGLKGLGAVAPGYRADLVLLKDLKQMEVERVFKDGVDARQRLANLPDFVPTDPAILHSVKAPTVTADKLRLPVQKQSPVIEMIPYQLETNFLTEAVPTQNGAFVPGGAYTKLCVVERHGKNGNIAVAPLKGYGIKGGAIATTVAHDSHNIIAAGDNDRDLVLAINRLSQIDGGYVLVQNGAVAGEVPLAVAGLMSTASAEEVQTATGKIIQMAAAMGIPYYIDPFISLSFLALPVIPHLRLTDKGLFDADKFRLIEP